MSRFHHLGSSLVKALFRSAWPVIVISLLMTALSVYYTVNHLSMRTSRNDLVGTDLRIMRLSEEMDRQFGSRDNLAVVVENSDPKHCIQFVEALAAELGQYPQNFREIFYRVDPQKFKHWALLYLEQKQLLEIKTKLSKSSKRVAALSSDPRLNRFFQVVNEEITRSMLGHLFTGFLQEEQEKEKIPDLGLLQASLEQLELSLNGGEDFTSPLKSLIPGEMSDLGQAGYFFTENEKYLLLLVTTSQEDYTSTAEDVKLLRQVLDRVKARFPGIRAGVTGPGALEADEMSEAMADIELASSLPPRPDVVNDHLFPQPEKNPGARSSSVHRAGLDFRHRRPGGGAPEPALHCLWAFVAGNHRGLRHPLVCSPGRGTG